MIEHNRPDAGGENGDENAPGTTTQPRPNISTEHQRPGDARNPSDTLGRDLPQEEDDGGRKSSLTRNE